MNQSDAPCQSAATNFETGQCFEHAYKDADRRLNSAYKDIEGVLDQPDREKLRAAQRAWLKYRDATCAAERDLYGIGTGANPAALACLEAETRERVADLQKSYGWKLQKAQPENQPSAPK